MAAWRNYSDGDGVLSPQTVSIVLADDQAQAAVIDILSPPTAETAASLQSRTINFTVANAGSYYIGFRAQQTGDDYTAFDDIVLTGSGGFRFHDLDLRSSNSVSFNQNVAIFNDLSVDGGTLADFDAYDVTVEGSVVNNGSIRPAILGLTKYLCR